MKRHYCGFWHFIYHLIDKGYLSKVSDLYKTLSTMVMVTKGLLVRLEAREGKDGDVERFLHSALPLVISEAGTTAWFAVRFGKGEYGILDFFPDDAARDAHLSGAVAKALSENAEELFAQSPVISLVDVLASKIPTMLTAEADTRGLLMTFFSNPGSENDVEQFLREAQQAVAKEPDTTAWFAIHLGSGEYGIFDVFPDNAGRLKHIFGRVPRQLASRAFKLLGSLPDLEMIKVLTEKTAVPDTAVV